MSTKRTDTVAVDESEPPVLVASADPQASSIWWSNNGSAEGGVPFDFVQIVDTEAVSAADQILALPQTRYRHIFVDLPGNLHNEDTLSATLEVAHDVIVPIEPEPLSWDPTATTIDEVLAPIGIPYHVVVNGWDPRDGFPDLEATAKFIAANGWTACNTVVRRYKVHSRAAVLGTVVTQYGKSRIAQEGLSDFHELALELGYGGGSRTDDGPKIHAAVNQKGGVGKTTLIMNLAAVVHQVLTKSLGGRHQRRVPRQTEQVAGKGVRA